MSRKIESAERLAAVAEELKGWTEATVEELNEAHEELDAAMGSLGQGDPLDVHALDRASEAAERLLGALQELRTTSSIVDYVEDVGI